MEFSFWLFICDHRLGTAQKSDDIVYQSLENSDLSIEPFLSCDGQYLMINMTKGSSGPNSILIRPLNDTNVSFEKIVPLNDSNYSYICNKGSNFYFWTNEQAPLGKGGILLRLDQQAGHGAGKSISQ